MKLTKFIIILLILLLPIFPNNKKDFSRGIIYSGKIVDAVVLGDIPSKSLLAIVFVETQNHRIMSMVVRIPVFVSLKKGSTVEYEYFPYFY